eukprot:2274921-Pyramimonas_sp.AAC.1
MRVYVTAAAKRAAVVKEDDLLAKTDIQANPDTISKTSTLNSRHVIAKASNIMTSRYVCKWKFVKNEKGEMKRIIRLRL